MISTGKQKLNCNLILLSSFAAAIIAGWIKGLIRVFGSGKIWIIRLLTQKNLKHILNTCAQVENYGLVTSLLDYVLLAQSIILAGPNLAWFMIDHSILQISENPISPLMIANILISSTPTYINYLTNNYFFEMLFCL